MKSNKNYILIAFIVISICGCSDKGVNNEEYNSTIELDYIGDSNKFDETKSTKTDILDININSGLSNNDDSILPIKDIKEFDKITISNRNATIEITDKDLLSLSFDFIIGYAVKCEEPPNPEESEEITYNYYKGHEIYSVVVYNNNLFEYNGIYYKSTNNLYYLAESFLPEPDFIANDRLLNKIYKSSLIKGGNLTPYYYLGSDRSKLIINQINRLLIENEINIVGSNTNPDDMGKLVEELVFYNHGDVFKMYIYDEYLQITNEMEDRLYKANNNNSFVSSILSILYAD